MFLICWQLTFVLNMCQSTLFGFTFFQKTEEFTFSLQFKLSFQCCLILIFWTDLAIINFASPLNAVSFITAPSNQAYNRRGLYQQEMTKCWKSILIFFFITSNVIPTVTDRSTVISSWWFFLIKAFGKKSKFQIEQRRTLRNEIWYTVAKASSYHNKGDKFKIKYNISKVAIFFRVESITNQKIVYRLKYGIKQ